MCVCTRVLFLLGEGVLWCFGVGGGLEENNCFGCGVREQVVCFFFFERTRNMELANWMRMKI